MSKRKTSSLLIDEQPLQVIPSLAEALGVNAAIFLQQINYWIKHAEHAGEGRKYRQDENGVWRWWTFNTYAGWQEQMPWMSVSGLRKAAAFLKSKKLIIMDEFNQDNRDRTPWYAIDYEAVERLREAGEVPPESDEAEEEPAHSGTGGVSESDRPPARKGHLPEPSEKDTSDVPESPENQSESTEEELTNVPSSSGDRLESEIEDGPPEPDLPQPEEPKPAKGQVQSIRQFAFSRFRDIEREAEEMDWDFDPLPEGKVKEYAAFYERHMERGAEPDFLDLVIWRLFAKASGVIEGEPPAWTYFGTARRAVLEGWRPPWEEARRSAEELKEAEKAAEEERRMFRELMASMDVPGYE